MPSTPWTVISLGGSIIVPDGIDTTFLKEFSSLIRTHVQQGMKFIIIAGGGKTSRRYQDAARDLGDTSTEDLDWLGIHATRLNGHLMRSVFRDLAHPALIKDPTAPVPDISIVIAAGWKPGWSTDYVAVQLAKGAHATRLVNLSNIDYVYTADPKKNPGATKIEKTTWADFRTLLPDHWDPGLSSPFDPVAAKDAEESGIEVAVIKGTSISNLNAYLSGNSFNGTLIKG